MTQRSNIHQPCPLCGRITRAHSRMELSDIEGVGRARPSCFATVICRDCAVAMVLRTQAAAATRA